MKRFKDFAKEENLDGDKAKLDFILGKEIIVTDYQLTNSKFANNNRMCLKLQFELEAKDTSSLRLHGVGTTGRAVQG